VTGSLAAAHAVAAPVATTLPAVGVQRAAWLLLAFPLAGAAILLLGGKRTNAWGHWIGVLMPVSAFVYAVIAFIAMLGYPGNQRSRVLTLFTWIHVALFLFALCMEIVFL
jgi:NADH-quinone oxidoreductase subunit L